LANVYSHHYGTFGSMGEHVEQIFTLGQIISSLTCTASREVKDEFKKILSQFKDGLRKTFLLFLCPLSQMSIFSILSIYFFLILPVPPVTNNTKEVADLPGDSIALKNPLWFWNKS
jgi:hypothetical protein